MFLPLFFLLLLETFTAGSRQSCSFCLETCSSTASNDSALCKCDADCKVFGDCCGDSTPPSSCLASQLSPFPDGVMLDCISTYLNPNISVQTDGEALLMVSSCPDSWIETEGGITAENCTSPNSTTTMPPVTSTVTGMVYRNEYCAFCNGVRELVAWQTNLVCNQRVYNLLKNKSISEIIQHEPDIFKRECQNCAFQTPSSITSVNTTPMRSKNYTDMVPRSCFPRVSSCLPHMLLENKTLCSFGDDAYANMKAKCASGMLDLVKVTSHGVVYRNVDCAICNGENVTGCFKLPQMMTNRIPELCFPSSETTTTPLGHSDPSNVSSNPSTSVPLIFPFRITLSNLGGGMVSVSTTSDSTSISLDCPERTAPVGLECVHTQCSEGYTKMGGNCSSLSPTPVHLGSNITVKNCTNGIFARIVVEYKSVVEEFGHSLICIGNVSLLHCPTSLVPINDSDYTRLVKDRLVYKNETVEVMFFDEHGRHIVCPESVITATINTSTTYSMPGLEELNYIGSLLSVLGAILILLTYTLFSKYRTLPGLLLINLCIAIMANKFFSIVRVPIFKKYPLEALCTSYATFYHFFYFSQFIWESIFSFEMVRKFYQARKLLTDSNKTKYKFFVAYLCIGWCLPLLITASCITLNFSVDGLVQYGVDNAGRIAGCTLNHFEAFSIAFIITLILTFSSNLLMFLLTTFLLCRASRNQSNLQPSNISSLIRVWLAILSTTCLTWTFFFVAIAIEWVTYLFVILNSIQGLLMFLAFVFTKNTLRMYLDCFRTIKRKVTLSKNCLASS